jgi:hypothetical protein
MHFFPNNLAASNQSQTDFGLLLRWIKSTSFLKRYAIDVMIGKITNEKKLRTFLKIVNKGFKTSGDDILLFAFGLQYATTPQFSALNASIKTWSS